MAGKISEAVPTANGSQEDMREIARLGETDDVKRQALKELRQLIADEPRLCCPTEDAFLIMLLQARKYDVLCTFKNIKRFCKTKRDNPEIFNALDPYHIPFDVACRKYCLSTASRGKDPQGRHATVVRIGAWNTDICSLTDFFRVGVVICLHVLQQEEARIRGIVVVLDVAGLGPHHILHYTPSVIKTYIKLVQDCLPLRIKAIYVINHPSIFTVFLAIAKRCMKNKMVRRIRLLGHNVGELHGLVPDDLIPNKYGGTLDSYDHDEEERQLKAEQGFFEKLSLCVWKPPEH